MDETSDAHDWGRYPAPSSILVGVSAPEAAGVPAPGRALPALAGPIPTRFCAAGTGLIVVGGLPWLAVLLGARGITWPIRVLAAVALVVGVFVVLVGIGLLRARHALRAAHARAEGEGCDARGPDTACAGCDSACPLDALR